MRACDWLKIFKLAFRIVDFVQYVIVGNIANAVVCGKLVALFCEELSKT